MIRRLLLIIILLQFSLFIFCLSRAKAEERVIQIEYTFTVEADPDKALTGFELYQEGSRVCVTDEIVIRQFECAFEVLPGTYDYTMAATYDDGTLSPQSPPYSFTIDDPTTPTTQLQPVIIRMSFTPIEQ